uniref:C2H2-type domain-containing protein n=1 Tax=Romanomermis culicivorax TaxID=13658 RepID=A0A915IW30_ROMCU
MEGRPLPAHLLSVAAASTSLVIPAASFGLNSSFSVVTRGNILSNNTNKFVENFDIVDNASGTHSVDRILYNEYKPTISPALLSVVEKVSSCENLHSIVAAAAAATQQPQIQASQAFSPSVGVGGSSLPMLNNLVQGIVAVQPPQTLSVVDTAVPCCSSDIGGNEDVYIGRPVSPLRGRGRPPINPGPDASSRQHNCPYCSKTFPNNSALLKHKLIHSDERRFICEICQKAFKRPDHLNGHLNVHKTVKPFPCVASSCDKSYCDARSLRRHLEHAHNIKNAIVQSSRGKVMVKCGDYHSVQVISKTSTSSNAGGAATSSICSPSSAADQQIMGGGGCLSSTTSTSGGNHAINATTNSTNSRESQESIDTISGRTSIIDPTALAPIQKY